MTALSVSPSPLRLSLSGLGLGRVFLRFWLHAQKTRHNFLVSFGQASARMRSVSAFHCGTWFHFEGR